MELIMTKSIINILFTGFVFSLSLPADAKLFKWVDDQGVTHYGEVIPPEYANKEKDALTKGGLIEKRPVKESAESINAKEQAEQKRKIDNQASEEHKRRDNALLNTYSNEAEIDAARERSLVLITARIETNVMLLKSSQSTLEGHKKEADSRNSTGKKIPVSLANDITQAEERVNRYSTELSKSEEQLAAVKLRFDNEKALYRKLKDSKSKP
jgi:hypothetical protein